MYHLSCLPPKLENHISTTKLQPGITRCIEACASGLLPSIENKEEKIEVKVIYKSHDHYLIISVVLLFHKLLMTYTIFKCTEPITFL